MISSKNAACKGQYDEARQTDGLKAVRGLGGADLTLVIGAKWLRRLAGSYGHRLRVSHRKLSAEAARGPRLIRIALHVASSAISGRDR